MALYITIISYGNLQAKYFFEFWRNLRVKPRFYNIIRSQIRSSFARHQRCAQQKLYDRKRFCLRIQMLGLLDSFAQRRHYHRSAYSLAQRFFQNFTTENDFAYAYKSLFNSINNLSCKPQIIALTSPMAYVIHVRYPHNIRNLHRFNLITLYHDYIIWEFASQVFF